MTKMRFPVEILLVLLGYSGMWQGTNGQTLSKPVLSGPSEAILNGVVEFFCEFAEVPSNLSILLELFHEGNTLKPISFYTALRATFPLKTKLSHDGRLFCKASGHNNTEVIPSHSDLVHFRVIEKAEGAQITTDPPSEEFWEGESVTLQCNVSRGTYILYKWFLNDMPLELSYNRSHGQMTIQRLFTNYSGMYRCEASNQFNGTLLSMSSTEKNMHVKELLSEPEISFQVSKDGEGNFVALVTCQSDKGTPPITFELLRNNHSTIGEHEGLNATFSVPILLDKNMGLVHCKANDGTRTVHSKPLNLTVESVGGAVTMKTERTVEHDFEVLGVWLQCSVERGTFPHYYWFLNNTMLQNPGKFHFVIRPNDSVLAFILALESAGIYHCEAANAFDNTRRLQSRKNLISKEVMNTIPRTAVAVVFTCFFLLVVTLTACCHYGLVLRKRTTHKYRDLEEDFMHMSNITSNIEFEDEYDEENDGFDDHEMAADAYEEDQDVVEASRIEDSDEDEEDDHNSIQDEKTEKQEEETEEQEEETEEQEEETEEQEEETEEQEEETEEQEEETGEQEEEAREQEEETGEQEEETVEQEEETGEQEEETGEQEEETGEQEEETEEQEEETGEQNEETRKQEEEAGEQDEETGEQEEETGEQKEETGEQEEETRKQEEETGEQKAETGEQEEETEEQEDETEEQEEETGKQEEETGEQKVETGEQEEETGEQEEETEEQEEETEEQKEETGE